MTEDFQEDERGQSRRSVLAMLGLTGLATMGSALWLSQSFYRDNDPDVIIYRNGETEEGDPEDTPYQDDDIPEETYRRINSWDEALPGGCHLEEDERDWLVGRMDEYDNLEQDEFFEYVGREVRLDKSGDELRMTVDPDYSGEFDSDTNYIVEKGYNLPETC